MEILTLFFSQLIFSFARTLNVRYTSKDMVTMSIITSTAIKLSWLVSSAIGIKAVIDVDFLTMFVYVFSGLIGDYVSFKVKIK